MIEHVHCTYEAFDGKMFDDEDECLNYELNTLYKESGIRFITITPHIVEDLGSYPDDVYNMAMYVMIDRKKKEENERFVDCAIKYFGWALLEDLDLKSGRRRKYRMEMDKLVEIE